MGLSDDCEEGIIPEGEAVGMPVGVEVGVGVGVGVELELMTFK